MCAVHPRCPALPPSARWLALAIALIAGAAPARAQFGPDLRLTGPPLLVSQTARNDAWSVATDDAGNVHVVYFDTRFAGAGDVPPFHRRYDAALDVWEPEVRLPDIAAANTRYVSLAVDCRGQAHVVWIHTVAGDNHYVYYKKRDAAGTWGADVLLHTRQTQFWDVRDPTIAVDHLEDVYVAWAQGLKNAQGDPVHNVVYRVYDRTSDAWEGVQALTGYVSGVDPAPGARAPSVAAHHRFLGSGSLAHVAWADFVSGTVRYRVLRHLPAGGTTQRGTVALHLGGGVASPTVAARCGEIHVAWGDPGSGAIVHRRGDMTISPAETTAFEPELPTGLLGQDPSLAVDGLNDVQLVMLSAGAVVHGRRDWLTGTWSSPATVSDPAAVPADASLAVDTRGGVHVVWTDSRAGLPDGGGAFYDRAACLVGPAPGPAAGQVGVPAAGRGPVLEPDLAAARAAAGPDGRLPVLIVLRERPDPGALRPGVAGLHGPERRRRVIETMRTAAGRAQAGVLAELVAATGDGRAARVRSLWSANAVGARVSPALLDRLAAREDVAAILHDPERPMLEHAGHPGDGTGSATSARAAGARGPRAGAAAERALPPTPAWSVDWIGAPAVWDQGYRGAGVLVAVIDTGVDYTHPDLAGRIWVNDDEIPGNALDDDGNGVVDDVHGYDAANDDGDPLDDNGHGTHVGGSVAGDGTGGTVTGVAPEARLMAVKVLTATGAGTFADIIAGIEYAVANGAQVLNLSLGGFCESAGTRAMLRTTADAVGAAGVTMCVAAANDRCKQRPPNMMRTPGDVPPPWLSPDQPVLGATGGVTTVGATGFMTDAIASFSSPGPVDWTQPPGFGDWALCDAGTPNVGLLKPDVSAPGLDVLSTVPGGGYDLNSGTSMATPHVAGLVALVLSRNPSLASDQVHEILETTALDLGTSGKDTDYGAGRVRAPEALAATPAPVQVEPGPGAGLPPLALRRIAPNPAGPVATLEFALGGAGHVRLALYDVRGRHVRTLVDGARSAGVHREAWDGRDQRGAAVPAGLYLARLESGRLQAQRKLVWLGR